MLKPLSSFLSPNEHQSQIVARPDIPNNGGFPIMDCTKIEKELGWKASYGTAERMFADYKAELERGVYTKLFTK